MTKARIEDVQHVVHISTDSPMACRLCAGASGGIWQFEKTVNPYIEAHGYRLLHVGLESILGSEGLYHHTVAVVGK